MQIVAGLKRHWRSFRDDEPGHRFEHQYERMQRAGGEWIVAAVAIGSLITVGGIVLLFVPGPGLLLLVFGLALIASVSRGLARRLDRAEPLARRVAARVRAGWQSASLPAKVGGSVAFVAFAGAGALGLYRVCFS